MGNEDRHLQRQQRQQEAGQSPGLAGDRAAGRCLPPRTEGDTIRTFLYAAIKEAGYSAVWRGQKSWNGVAILARGVEPIVTHTALPGDPSDTQGRYIEAAVGGVLIASLYAPNGNPQPGPKFTYKLAWMERLVAHAAALYAVDAPVVLAGDYNVVPTDADIYPTKSYAKNALVQPEPRALFQRLLDQGWVDAIRTLHPDTPMYTFWDYKRNRWPRDAGLRIDHLLLNREAAKRLVDAGVDREVRGLEGASDHAPAWVVFSDPRAVRTKPRTKAVAAEGKAKDARYCTAPVARVPCWSSTAIHSPIAPTTPCRKRFCGAVASPPALFSASPTYCCAFTARNSHVRCWWPGTRWKCPPTGTRNSRPTKAVESSTTPCLSSSSIIPKFVTACGFQNAKAPGFEADDFLAAASAAEERRGGTVLIASGDRDTFQLASDRTTILYPVRGQGLARINPAEVRARYGVDPAQVPDFIALRGDPSDKLPGAPGVGATGAATLLQRYGSLEAALKAGRFPANAESLRLFRSIATMNRKAPLPSLRNQKPTWDTAAELARKWELNQLARRLEELGRSR